MGREKKLRSRIVRLFTGLALEYPVRRNLELVLEHLAPLVPLNWSPADNFHITTKFIGNWAEEDLPRLEEALRGVSGMGEIAVRIEGFGWFPNPHQPRFVFAGVQAPAALHELAKRTDAACAALGIASEAKAYVPHVTLGRVKERVNLTPLRQAIAQLPSADFGFSKATKFLLYKSVPGEKSSVYTVIREFGL